MTDKDMLWYWFANVLNVGRRKKHELLDVYGSPEAIYNETREGFIIQGLLNEEQIEELYNKDDERVKAEYDRMARENVRFIHMENKDYPARLKTIPDPPLGLYIKGNILPANNRPMVSVIGSRRCSDYGYDIAYKTGYELGLNNIAVVSGMAKGVDGASQKGCIDAGGISYGILGCGVDICYPRDNIGLYMDIQKNGSLISEYCLKTNPIAGFFPERNRIISGLGEILIVVEAGKKSGTFITVEMALEQGRDVYAVPGRITDSFSKGCNKLIKDGAFIYDNIYDVIEHLKSKNILDENIKKSENKNISIATNEKIVYAILDFEPKHINYILEKSGLAMKDVIAALFELEMKHIISQPTNNYYVLNI